MEMERRHLLDGGGGAVFPFGSKEIAMTNEFVMRLRHRAEKGLEVRPPRQWYTDLLKRRIAALDRLMERRRKTGLA